jgi:lipoprotein NlpI
VASFLFVLFVTLGVSEMKGAEARADDLINQAQAAELKGDYAGALALASKAIALDTKNAQSFWARGRLYATHDEPGKAIADFDQVLKLEPRAGEVYQLRGFEHFKLGHFDLAIADFDKFLTFVPQRAPHHWQRGIAYYYAGRYEEGRKQFESHRSVNPNDVENAAWHFLCVARVSGVEKARAALMPIQGDSRVPMAQIYELFSGKVKAADVLAAAQAGEPSPAKRRQQLFYAYLYIGLYYEATGEEKQAREHIFKAAEQYSDDDYMGAVARVHAATLRVKEKTGK